MRGKTTDGEDGDEVETAFTDEGDGDADLPLMKVGDDGARLLVVDILAEEPSDEVAKDDGVVGLGVVRRRRNASCVPKITFPFIQAMVS